MNLPFHGSAGRISLIFQSMEHSREKALSLVPFIGLRRSKVLVLVVLTIASVKSGSQYDAMRGHSCMTQE